MKRMLSVVRAVVRLGVLVGLAGCLPGMDPVQAATDKAITSFSFESPAATGEIDESAATITVGVPAGTEVASLVAVFTTTGVRVTVGGVEQESGLTENDFRAPVIYGVEASDGTTAAYTVNVIVARPLSSAKAITSFSFAHPPAEGIIDEAGGTIEIVVPHGTDLSSLAATFSSTGAAVTVDDTEQTSGLTVNDFTRPLTYVVTAGDGSMESYVVTVTRAPGAEKAIMSFSIQSPAAAGVIDAGSKVVRVRLPDGADLSSLVAVFTASGASVTVHGVAQVSGVTTNDFSEPLDYLVTAEDRTTALWTVRVTGTIGLVVNEMDIDQVGADVAEYLELYALSNVDCAGIVIVLLNGGVVPGQEYARIDLTPAGVIPAGGFLVVAGPGVAVQGQGRKLTPPGWELSNRVQNGPSDAVMLFDTLGRKVIDTVSYNGVLHRVLLAGETVERDATEGAAGAAADSNASAGSLGRMPSGRDTAQNGLDFKFCPTMTPGAPNQ